MRVLFVTTGYPTEAEPLAGIFVREHALAAAESADVSVLHLSRGEPLRVRRVEGEPLPTWRVGFPERPRSAGLLAAAAAGLRRVPAHDLVHAHFFLAAAPLTLLSRKPLVVTEQWSVFLPEDPLQLSPPLRLAARLSFERAAAVLPVSRALERGILDVAPGARTQIVPNIADTSVFRRGGEPEDGRLLAAGIFYEAKGFDRLLALLPELVAVRPDIRLDLAGDGPLRAELERAAAGLPVTFHGRLEKIELAKLMQRAELFVLSSRFETSSAVGIEALASGLPVVGEAVGAIPELVADGNGVLAERGGLAQAVLAGLEQDFDRDAISERARARYSRAAVGAELTRVYARLLNGR